MGGFLGEDSMRWAETGRIWSLVEECPGRNHIKWEGCSWADIEKTMWIWEEESNGRNHIKWPDQIKCEFRRNHSMGGIVSNAAKQMWSWDSHCSLIRKAPTSLFKFKEVSWQFVVISVWWWVAYSVVVCGAMWFSFIEVWQGFRAGRRPLV